MNSRALGWQKAHEGTQCAGFFTGIVSTPTMTAAYVDLERLRNGFDDRRFSGPVLAHQKRDGPLEIEAISGHVPDGRNRERPLPFHPRFDLDLVDDHRRTILRVTGEMP
jgi:hypothetical protein